MKIHGSCHCGNISFDLDWRPEPEAIPARACTCSFCVKHGGVWTSNPQATMQVRVKDAAAESIYAFATRTADFHVCARCGAVPLVTCDLDGRTHAVVNVNAFDNVDRAMLQAAPHTFEGETPEARLARRRRNWIADVRIAYGP